MRLISLTCDQKGFKNIEFNPYGITLILGDNANHKGKDTSSNGVGKTLSLGLIHHCLGANVDKDLAVAVPDWIFTLLFSFKNKEYRISRSGNGKYITFNDEKITLKELRNRLNELGIFYLDPKVPNISFRSLFKRFARYEREDCISPLRMKKEGEYDALLRTLYLLNVDTNLVVSKQISKKELDDFKKLENSWKTDKLLHDLFRAGASPKVRFEWLEKEILRLTHDIDNAKVSEDYRKIEEFSNELTLELRELGKDISILDFQIDSINKSLEEHPDITQKDLIELYNGLNMIFKPEILEHFEAVEKFHNSLSINRKHRLERDKLELLSQKNLLENKISSVLDKREKILSSLEGKTAIDEYTAIVKQIANLEEEKERINQYLTFLVTLKEKSQQIKEKRLEENRFAIEYLQTKPLKNIEHKFVQVAENIYPNLPAGIVLDSNLGDNQIRYDLTVQIEGDDSDGINSARILCFDFVNLFNGSNHIMDMLWHDNRLFSDMDPVPRSSWFSYVLNNCGNKQYIATLNMENYESMLSYFTEKEREMLKKSIVLKLKSDSPENKLLGIQYGKPNA